MKAINIITRIILVSTLIPMAALATPTRFKWGGVNVTYQDDDAKSVEMSIKSFVQGMADVALAETAERTLSFTMSKLNRKIILTAEAKGPGEKVEVRTLTLSNLDELDVAVPRSLQAIIEDVPVRDTAARGQIYGAERSKPSRFKASSGFQFSLGGAAPIADAFKTSDAFTTLGIGYVWDIDNFMVEIRNDYSWGTEKDDNREYLNSLSIGTHYVVWQNRFASVFTGIEFGFGWAKGLAQGSYTSGSETYLTYNSEEATGFLVAGNLGATFIRYADINVDLRFRAAMLTSKIDDNPPLTLGLALGIRY